MTMLQTLEREFARIAPAAIVLFGFTSAACRIADPQKELEIVASETYWAIDSSLGANHYLAPSVRLTIRNRGGDSLRGVEATASFRRKDNADVAWGSGWARLKKPGEKLGPGETVTIVIKSDGRYYSQGAPEQMLQHELFKDALVHVYFRIAGSKWNKMLETDIERRIGSRSVEPFMAAPIVGL
ncbi:MAG: hypothetical protein JXO72_05520, partial [Vicinamibacteria bacterium]|nr:hypothetical protein [Vicinamibacteria bacterium]